MPMNRMIGFALLAVGVLLIFLGMQSSEGLDDRISEAVTGEYTDNTLAYWIGGAAAAAAGVGLLLFGRK